MLPIFAGRPWLLRDGKRSGSEFSRCLLKSLIQGPVMLSKFCAFTGAFSFTYRMWFNSTK